MEKVKRTPREVRYNVDYKAGQLIQYLSVRECESLDAKFRYKLTQAQPLRAS